jgi:hypothetical protein
MIVYFGGARKVRRNFLGRHETIVNLNRLFAKETAANSCGATVTETRPMSLIDKIPDMTDEGVENMLANARRLQETGAPRQQAQAAELLPALEQASAERRSRKLEAAAAKRAAAPKRAAPKRAATTAGAKRKSAAGA